MQENDESERDKEMEELDSIEQLVQETVKKGDSMKILMSKSSAMDPIITEEYIASIVKKMKKVTHYDMKTYILYINVMENIKHVQLSFETNSNSTDSKTFINDTVEIMKILGKVLKLRNSTRAELDVSIMHHFENLIKKKDVDISIIEEINAKFSHLRNNDVGVQTDIQLYQIKQTKRYEEGEGKKRKEVHFPKDDKVQHKRKKIAQSEVEKNIMEKEESGTLGVKQGLPEFLQQKYIPLQRNQVHGPQGSTMNESQFRGELSPGFLEQLEAMQQLVQQLRSCLLVGEDNQQTMNKNMTIGSMVQELKMMNEQVKKAKKQQRQQEIMDMLNKPMNFCYMD